MEFYMSMNGRYVTAIVQMLFGASLFVTCLAGKRAAFCSLAREFEAYFYSFSPVILLIYILYKISFMF
jgi:hypothetical protein